MYTMRFFAPKLNKATRKTGVNESMANTTEQNHF